MFVFFLGELTESDNLFVSTTADIGFICRENYMPIFVSNITFPNSTFEAAARDACGDNTECLFDYAATLSTKFAQTTLNASSNIQNDNKVIGKGSSLTSGSHQVQCMLTTYNDRF
jgi:hypothetical protein